MKTKLEQLEARIQELVEIHLVGILPGQKNQRRFVQQLMDALRAHAAESGGAAPWPNVFTLVVRPEEIPAWQKSHLLEALREMLQTAGREAEVEFDQPPTISVAADASLPAGELRVVASREIKTLGPTHAIPSQPPPSQAEEEAIPQNAFLIIEGKKVFPLKDPVINIGRRMENQLVIDDPRVSRTHAQLRAIKGRYVIFDLNSTGGTFVNGQRTGQSILYPGDVISLAGVSLVFGQDNPPPRLDLTDTGPLIPQPLDRATVVLKPPTETPKSQK